MDGYRLALTLAAAALLGCGPGGGSADAGSDGTGGASDSTSTSVGDSGTDSPIDECGDGVFVPGVFCFEPPVVVEMNNWVIGDFFGDGAPEIAAVYRDQPTALVLGWDGAGITRVSPAEDLSGSSARTPVAGDFNGDGLLDLVHAEGNTIRTFINDGAALRLVSEQTDSEPTEFDSVAAVDLGADGRDELVFDRLYRVAAIWRFDGAEFAPTGVELQAAGCGNFLQLVRGDFGSGTNADVAVTGDFMPCDEPFPPESPNEPEVTVFLASPGADTFQVGARIPASFEGDSDIFVWPRGLLGGDFDGDGDDDLLTLGIERFAIHVNQGDGTFQSMAPVFGMSGQLASQTAAGDMDGNGDADLVMRREGSSTIVVDPFDPSTAAELFSQELVAHQLADLNGDGFADVIDGAVAVRVSSP